MTCRSGPAQDVHTQRGPGHGYGLPGFDHKVLPGLLSRELPAFLDTAFKFQGASREVGSEALSVEPDLSAV